MSQPTWIQWLFDGAGGVALAATLVAVYALEPAGRGEPESPPIETLAADSEEPHPPPPPPLIPTIESPPPVDPTPRIRFAAMPDGRFGVVTTTGNPDDPSDDDKKLTYSELGKTNNTRVWIDGQTPYFGAAPGFTLAMGRPIGEHAAEWVWEHEGILVKQLLELVAGDVSRRMDTLRVTYTWENTGAAQRTVGLRIMLDTLIGENDGVPFIVPGKDGLVTSPVVYRDNEVPDFVRALERPSLTNPGVIIDIGLRSGDSGRPSEVVLSHWPEGDAEWDYDRTAPFDDDSAVGLYYAPRPLLSAQTRSISFTYGLGTISSTRTRNAQLSLTAGGPFRAGGKFWLVALVQNPQPNQSVKVNLPDGISLAQGEPASKPVMAEADYTQLSWLCTISPGCLGTVELGAVLEPDATEERQVVTIEPRDAKMTIVPRGPVRSGGSFWVVVLVRDPGPERSVELTLPAGLEFASGETKAKPVPDQSGYVQIAWLVEVGARVSGTLELEAKLLPGDLRESAEVKVQAGSLVR